MSKGLNTPVGYINALVISSVYNGGAAPAAPTSLTAQNDKVKVYSFHGQMLPLTKQDTMFIAH